MNLTTKAKLSAAKVRTIKAPGKYQDGHGLMLVVQQSGTRQWVQRLVIQGVRRDIGLGGYPMTTLAEARDKAFLNRRVARSGGDPRKHQSAAPTFATIAHDAHGRHTRNLRNARYRQQWIDEIERHAFPVLGELPVDAITMRHILNVLEPIWHSNPKLARHLRQRIELIIDGAVVEGHRDDNPVPSGARVIAALGVCAVERQSKNVSG